MARVGENGNVQGSGGKYWRKGSLERPRHMWSRIVTYGLYSSGSGQQQMVGRCEHSNWPLGSVISGGFLTSSGTVSFLQRTSPHGVSWLARWLAGRFVCFCLFVPLFPSLVDYWTISIYLGRCEHSNWPLGSVISGGFLTSSGTVSFLHRTSPHVVSWLSRWLAGWFVCFCLFLCLFPSLVDYWTISIYLGHCEHSNWPLDSVISGGFLTSSGTVSFLQRTSPHVVSWLARWLAGWFVCSFVCFLLW